MDSSDSSPPRLTPLAELTERFAMGLVTRRHLLAGGASILAFRALGAEKEPVGLQLILAADVSCSVNAERYAV
jgi:hypothetical protein